MKKIKKLFLSYFFKIEKSGCAKPNYIMSDEGRWMNNRKYRN